MASTFDDNIYFSERAERTSSVPGATGGRGNGFYWMREEGEWVCEEAPCGGWWA